MTGRDCVRKMSAEKGREAKGEAKPLRPLKPLKKNVSISLDSEVIQKIRALAERDARNFSQYINMVLRDHIAEQEKKEK